MCRNDAHDSKALMVPGSTEILKQHIDRIPSVLKDPLHNSERQQLNRAVII